MPLATPTEPPGYRQWVCSDASRISVTDFRSQFLKCLSGLIENCLKDSCDFGKCEMLGGVVQKMYRMHIVISAGDIKYFLIIFGLRD